MLLFLIELNLRLCFLQLSNGNSKSITLYWFLSLYGRYCPGLNLKKFGTSYIELGVGKQISLEELKVEDNNYKDRPKNRILIIDERRSYQ